MYKIWYTESDSENETRFLLEELAEFLQPPFLILLSGDLGAGKTFSVSSFLKYWKINKFLGSPTFSILNTYKTNLLDEVYLFHHFDLYRLNTFHDFLNLGFDDILHRTKPLFLDEDNKKNSPQKEGAFIEWSEKIKEILPDWSLKLVFEKEEFNFSFNFNEEDYKKNTLDLSNFSTKRKIFLKIPTSYIDFYLSLQNFLKKDSKWKLLS